METVNEDTAIAALIRRANYSGDGMSCFTYNTAQGEIVRGTCGGALVEIERYAEAKFFLEPHTLAGETPLDRMLRRALLARAEHALGDATAARRHVSEARKICNATAPSRERIAAEVGAHEQRPKLEPAQLPG
jgi:hypothetical protein